MALAISVVLVVVGVALVAGFLGYLIDRSVSS